MARVVIFAERGCEYVTPGERYFYSGPGQKLMYLSEQVYFTRVDDTCGTFMCYHKFKRWLAEGKVRFEDND